MKKLIFILLLITFSNNILAQVTDVIFKNKSFKKVNNNWYLIGENSEKYLVDERSITVRLKDGVSKNELVKLNKKYGIEIGLENILGYIDLILPDNMKFYEVMEEFDKENVFESIETNGFAIPCSPLVPNDPYFYSQNYLFFYPEPYIQADEVWNIETGDPSVIVAVIGSGVDKNNLDLGIGGNESYSNLWSDGSGGFGWSYVTNNNNPIPHYSNSHETTVAGVIAAKTNNGQAIAGIAGGWNTEGSKIMAIRLSEDNYGYYHSYIVDDAILWAVSHGAKIINMSFSHIPTSSALLSALNYATNQKGCILIASAGQYDATHIGLPAADDNVMAVFGVLKNGSSYGPYNGGGEIAAPCEDIFTLLNATPSNPYNCGNIEYGGTTLAAAQVSGIAALIKSKYPQYINYDIRKLLNRSAEDIGNDTDFGNGLVQANDALLQAAPSYQVTQNQPQNVTLSGGYNTNPVISWGEVTTETIDKYFIYRAYVTNGVYTHFSKVGEVNDNGASSFSWTDNGVVRQLPRYATSTHYYRVTSVDDDGKESVTSNEVSTTSDWANKNIGDESSSDVVKYEYSLSDNYPNPFNPSTKITYTIKEKGFVTLRIFDILGREVAELVNEHQTIGRYSVKFEASNLPSGVYIYKLQAGKFASSKKMILTK